jgi:hypothetical protein
MDHPIGFWRAIASLLVDKVAHAWNASAEMATASANATRAIPMRRRHRAVEIRVDVTTTPLFSGTSARVALRVLPAGCGWAAEGCG